MVKIILHRMQSLDFHFSPRDQKLKKEKWQCSQKLDLKPMIPIFHMDQLTTLLLF